MEKRKKETLQEIRLRAKETMETDARFWYKGCYEGKDGVNDSYWNAKSRADILAQEIVNQGISKLEKLKPITRNRSYKVPTHDGVIANPKSRRVEEMLAKSMLDRSYRDFGIVLDYQVPLKDTAEDKRLGKIDLIAYHEEKQVLTLLELKKPDSEEPLLRAVLEIYTYWKTVDKAWLLESYSLPPDVKVEKAVLLFQDSYPFNEYKNKNKRKSPYTLELMERLDVKFYGVKIGVTDL